MLSFPRSKLGRCGLYFITYTPWRSEVQVRNYSPKRTASRACKPLFESYELGARSFCACLHCPACWQLLDRVFGAIDVEEMMDACELARQYDVPDCESCLLQRLQDQILLSGAAISIVLDKAASLAMPQLELLALERCSSMVITPVAFQGFSPYALNLCLSAAHLKASEASIFEAVINWGKQQLSNNPVLSMPDVLADIMPKVQLDSIPADVLLGLMTSLHLTPAEATSLQGAQQPQAQPCLSKQYARRPWGELGKDIACTDIDTIQFACQQHQGARSRHCLKSGTGRYVWHLCIERYSSCTWIGLVDDTADMTRQVSYAAKTSESVFAHLMLMSRQIPLQQ